MPDVAEDMYRSMSRMIDCEPVSGDFLIKKTGFRIFRSFAGIEGSHLALEVGCGAGANSAFFSSEVGRIVATDLFRYDAGTHTIGMQVAKTLFKRLNAGNVDLVSCSGDKLPFPDCTFDFVVSFSVLEHIANKEMALKEMLRVTRPGGRVFFAVPTYVQSICSFGHLFLYVARRTAEVVMGKLFGRREVGSRTLLPVGDDSTRAASVIAGSFRKNHPSFPMPEPHGTYPSIFHEFARQLPWNWTALAKRCGAKSVETFAYLFLPFNLLEIFSTRLVARLYSATTRFHMMAARTPLKYFSYSYCVVARK